MTAGRGYELTPVLYQQEENLPDDPSRVQEVPAEKPLRYLFLSTGEQEDLIKLVEYSYITEYGGRRVYNLGFGDYDLLTDTISDSVLSNNGDVYTVFNTVLSSIPMFFEGYPGAVMMVQGSDYGAAFEARCKSACAKRCVEACRNLNRRIGTYRRYVDKNFTTLAATYDFMGGIRQADGSIYVETYAVGMNYDAVFCSLKK